MTKDLTPKKDSDAPLTPLQELDWTDDSFNMEIVSDRIYDRDINNIFDNLSLLNDRGGETIYYPSLAESGEHTIRMAIPPELMIVFEGISEKYHNTDFTDGLRIAMIHGMSIYEHKLGCEIEAMTDDAFTANVSRNHGATSKVKLSVGISYNHVDYSCRIDGRVYKLLKKWSAHASIKKEYMIGLWVLYSFRTHPKLNAWYPFMDDILEACEYPMRIRLNAVK